LGVTSEATVASREAGALNTTEPAWFRRLRLGRLLLGLVLPVSLFITWWLTTTQGVLDRRLIPTPLDVVQAWDTWIFGPRSSIAWNSGTWLEYIQLSAQRVFIGFAIALVAGIVLGALIGWYSFANATLDPFLQWLRPIPVTAWMPFVTLIFGIRETSAIVLIALGSFFPILLNTAAGVRGTREVLIRAALMLGTPRWRLIWKVALPAAVPSMVTGIRLGMGIAWVLVVVAEFVGVKGGLGYALWTGFQFSRQDLIVCDIITLGVLGLITDRLILLLARTTIHWSKQF
jgi:NitT/TauT family transport system permease protein